MDDVLSTTGDIPAVYHLRKKVDLHLLKQAIPKSVRERLGSKGCVVVMWDAHGTIYVRELRSGEQRKL